jgi:hypothetical protein
LWWDGVRHDERVRERWYVLPGLAQAFWHANTIRKVNVKVGAALSRLSRKYRRSLSVQAMLWPGNWRREAFQVRAADGAVLGDALRKSARAIIREVYGGDRPIALLMLDRATLNNFIQIKALRVLADHAYCMGEIAPGYLDDLGRLGCDGGLLGEHSRFVDRARRAMTAFQEWLSRERPEVLDDPVHLAVVNDAFHRNWRGLRESIPASEAGHNLRGLCLWRRFGRRRTATRALSLIDDLSQSEIVGSLREERDALRMFDALAHLERDTYADLIVQLAEFDPPPGGDVG